MHTYADLIAVSCGDEDVVLGHSRVGRCVGCQVPELGQVGGSFVACGYHVGGV